MTARFSGLEVATVGGGTTYPYAQSWLRLMGCAGAGKVYRFAQIVAAATLALEIATQPDELDALGAVDVPTLVIVGAQDSQFLAPSRAIAAVVPGARYAEIPDAGHSPQFEQPDAWRAVMVEFLDSL